MARFAFVALAYAVIGAVGALELTMPSEGSILVADSSCYNWQWFCMGRDTATRTTGLFYELPKVETENSVYTVEWDGTGESRFEIDLHYCDAFCLEDDCGEWVTNLCPLGKSGCLLDSAGDYDVAMPEPMMGRSNIGYKIRVADINDDESVDCSDPFTLMPSEEIPIAVEVDGPVLVVTSPMEGDMVEECMEYTVEWDYDDGFGSAAGRFHIDLFEAYGSGDCGTFYAALCDKEYVGCKDTQGDYGIALPCNVYTGEYKIRVGVFDDDSTFGCSGSFTILSSTAMLTSAFAARDENMSMSFRFMS